MVHGDHISVLGLVDLDGHVGHDGDHDLPHAEGYGLVEGVVSVENAGGYVFHKHFGSHKLDH